METAGSAGTVALVATPIPLTSCVTEPNVRNKKKNLPYRCGVITPKLPFQVYSPSTELRIGGLLQAIFRRILATLQFLGGDYSWYTGELWVSYTFIQSIVHTSQVAIDTWRHILRTRYETPSIFQYSLSQLTAFTNTNTDNAVRVVIVHLDINSASIPSAQFFKKEPIQAFIFYKGTDHRNQRTRLYCICRVKQL